MLHIVDHFPIFAPELSSAIAGSADLLTGNSTSVGQQEKTGTYPTNESNNLVSCSRQGNEVDELIDECLAFRSYN